MSEELIKATGELTLTLTDSVGTVKQKVHVPNIVVTAGKDFIASRMAGASQAVMSHMAIGSSNANLVAANTTLATEVVRVALATAGGTVAGSVVSFTAVFGPGTPALGAAVVEAGIFNAASAGTMLCRTTFDVINKGDEDTLTINWNVTIN